MKRFLLIALMAFFAGVTVAAGTPSEAEKKIFSIGMFPGFGTDGTASKYNTYNVAINLTVGLPGNVEGLALSGLVDIKKGEVDGVQIGGLGNISRGTVRGVQLGGLFNVAKTVHGVQFAPIVNVADDSDCPIGLINIIRNGEMGIALSYDAAGTASVTFKSGGRYTYGIIGAGYNIHLKGNEAIVAEAGLGARIPVASWFRIGNEFKVSSIGAVSSESTFKASYNLLPGFLLGKHVEIFGGASLDYLQSADTGKAALLSRGHATLWADTSSISRSLLLGWTAGIQFIF